MSVRTPFMPLAQSGSSSASLNAPGFTPNQGNPLHRSANPDPEVPLGMENSVLPLPGLMAHRTSSHGNISAPKNIFQLAGANLGRPKTTAPGSKQLNNSLSTNSAIGYADTIVTPKPIRASIEKPPILTTPDTGFKAPVLPVHISLPRGMSPGESLGSLDISNAHIPDPIQHKRQSCGVLIRQQPSPETSGGSDEINADCLGSFRTSTPYGRRNGQALIEGHGPESSFTGPQRVFPQNFTMENPYDQLFAQQQQAPVNRKHSRERYAAEGDTDQSAKRQRNSVLLSVCSCNTFH